MAELEPVKHSQKPKKDEDVVLKMYGITKRFPGVLANDRVDFDLKRGEIHALLGENGAGKTTLMKIAFGLYQAEAGAIFLHGKKVVIDTPHTALGLGLGMVHQHPMLINPFTTIENIILGMESSREPFLNLEESERKVLEVAEKYNLHIDPRARVYQLSMGERQQVDILKVLYRNAKILILDEPTSVLTAVEVKGLLEMLKRMAQQHGVSIVFITHRLPKVMAISDRVTILRKGRVVGNLLTKETNERELARKMVGREVIFDIPKEVTEKGDIVLEAHDIRARNDKGLPAVKGVSLSVREGEIVGIAGVAGNGQREMVEVITSLRRADEGRVVVAGKNLTNVTPRLVMNNGLAYIPGDRIRRGSLSDFSIEENLLLGYQNSPPFAFRWFLPLAVNWFLNRIEILKHARALISRFGIKTTGPEVPARTLSGGNLQKLVIAREISRAPKIMICEEPTRGLDVGATEYVRRRMLEEVKKGMGILLVSSDLEEVMTLSDRIAVFYEGKIAGLLERDEADNEVVGQLMTGTVTIPVPA